VIKADLSGGDLAYLTTGIQKLFFEMFAAPEVKSVVDLKGKRIGITQFGSTTDFIARYMLTRAGLDAAHDVILVPMATQQNALLAMIAGRLDAGVLGAEIILQSKDLGTAKSVANMFDYDLLFYTGGIVAKRSWLVAHRNDAMNLVRGYLAGVAAVYRDKRAATAAMSKYLKITDAESLDRNYQMLMKVLSKDQIPRAAGITTGLEASKLAGAKTADPNAFIDPSFIDELSRDGFVEALYR
jgi:NitT/TauT family transport system substrate-binding protein